MFDGAGAMKHPRVIRRLLDALRPYQAERIYLFGSFARKEADALSDIDLVVIKRTAEPCALRHYREVELFLGECLGGRVGPPPAG
jgi:predicted nucleotidyltransferase